MRVTRRQAEENRHTVLRLASRRVREEGIRGLGVAALMNEAGLTHGAFYKQFASKADLVEQACERALAENLAAYEPPGRPGSFRAVVNALVSPLHRDAAGDGCTLAALGAEISRGPRGVRRTVTAGVRRIVTRLARLFPGSSRKKARRKALTAYSAMVGSLVIARAVDDPEFSREILAAVRAELGGTAR